VEIVQTMLEKVGIHPAGSKLAQTTIEGDGGIDDLDMGGVWQG
jgi:hypothetical protein